MDNIFDVFVTYMWVLLALEVGVSLVMIVSWLIFRDAYAVFDRIGQWLQGGKQNDR